jgi:hypothetical protein
MRFEIEQTFSGPPLAVAGLYADPHFYEALGELPKLGRPEVLDRQEDGSTVTLQIRFRFTGDLSPAVTAVVDPARLTWVEESFHDLEALTTSFRLRPDHYPDRLRSEGSARYEANGDGSTRRVTQGDLSVKVPLFGRSVESAIVTGLRQHLDAEVEVVERLLRNL